MKFTDPISIHLSKLKCRCGAEILLVPNVELMSKAIESHVQEHKKKNKGSKSAKAEAEYVEIDLISQLFNQICNP